MSILQLFFLKQTRDLSPGIPFPNAALLFLSHYSHFQAASRICYALKKQWPE